MKQQQHELWSLWKTIESAATYAQLSGTFNFQNLYHCFVSRPLELNPFGNVTIAAATAAIGATNVALHSRHRLEFDVYFPCGTRYWYSMVHSELKKGKKTNELV